MGNRGAQCVDSQAWAQVLGLPGFLPIFALKIGWHR